MCWMSSCRTMGRKAGGLFINPKKFSSLHKPCMKEMIMFLNCMATNQSDVEACAKQKEVLNVCIESQVIFLSYFRESWHLLLPSLWVPILSCHHIMPELSKCMIFLQILFQSKKNRKSWGSINYQLQRLSRGRK